MNKTFIQMCIDGGAYIYEIDKYIEKWHKSKNDISIYEYLGITEKEYNMFVMIPNSIYRIYQEERNKVRKANKIRKNLIEVIEEEIEESTQKYGNFRNHHEAYAVLKEEVDEYWDSVKQNKPNKIELVQIAAMAIKAIECL